tara:strand:- start:5625 stop:6440 length:816 start_codon:yes stop_codon:yes gene_type:complete
MAGKIKITCKAIIFTFFMLISNYLYSDTQISIGSVAFLPISESDNTVDYYYNNNLITKVLVKNKPFLLFGIPYYTQPGVNNFIFESKLSKKVFSLNIIQEDYSTQNISINKYRTKTKKELKRIASEKQKMLVGKNEKYQKYPDYKFINPVEGTVTGVYGTERYYNGKKGSFHNGHDIAAKTGTSIKAPSGGKIILTGNYYYNGKFVMINHGNNLISIFLHMNNISVKKDTIVNKGQIIGTVGNTGLSSGSHLHWSVLLNNTYIDPLALINK